jgi:hypothetical protein
MGYVAGLAFDWMPWHKNWLVRVEYLHHNLGGATATASLQPLAGLPQIPYGTTWWFKRRASD